MASDKCAYMQRVYESVRNAAIFCQKIKIAQSCIGSLPAFECGNIQDLLGLQVLRSRVVFCACAERSLVTVWSAPNYCYRCGNVASILCFDENLEREVKYFTETEENSTTMAPRNAVPYFL